MAVRDRAKPISPTVWRSETETTEQMRRWLEYDLVYIANWSLLLDIKVLLMTIPVVIRGTNAY